LGWGDGTGNSNCRYPEKVVDAEHHRERSDAVARELLGEDYPGIVTTDHWSAYKWLPTLRRQLCWAHLMRDFRKIHECPEPFASTGTQLLDHSEKLFKLWHRVSDGTLKRSSFKTMASRIRTSIRALLEGGGAYVSIHKNGVRPVCRGILELETAMWTFLRVKCVEPTNNLSERSLRPAASGAMALSGPTAPMAAASSNAFSPPSPPFAVRVATSSSSSRTPSALIARVKRSPPCSR